MNNETKKSLYSLLNLVDFFDTIDFLKLDTSKANNLRATIFDIINNSNQNIEKTNKENNKVEDKYELISILPGFFSSKKIFKSKKEILIFLEERLEIKDAKKWSSKTINDITGNVLLMILSSNEKDYKKIVSSINEYISLNPDFEKNIKKTTNKSKTSNFMNMWFDFFENYRKVNKDV